MKLKRHSQTQRIANLEEAVSKMYIMIEAIIDKLPKEEENDSNGE